jgi:putative membrane protein
MKWFLDVLRGMVIGLANVIPGVSGGTMMVSMGIYDKLIYSINNLFKKFKECFKILLPYLVGMGLAIILGSVALKVAFEKYPLPTNTLFIGLILGSLPIILKQIKGAKINALHVFIFLVFAALVIVPKVIANNTLVGDNVNGGSQALTLDVGHIIIYFLLGVIASASMVVPGISGSMMLKIFGYYEPIVTQTLGGTFKDAIPSGNWNLVLHNVGVLLPFAVGIVVGIFGVAKLIEFLLKKWKVPTYCGILGMVVASPVVILMDSSIYDGFNWGICVAAVIALIAGVVIALKLGADPEPAKE